jgi:hypothetical protein
LSATSLGLVVPVRKDANRADGTLGQTVIAASSIADFAAVVLLFLLALALLRGTGKRTCSSQRCRWPGTVEPDRWLMRVTPEGYLELDEPSISASGVRVSTTLANFSTTH